MKNFKSILEEYGTGEYKIIHTNGNEAKRRLFISTNGDICYFPGKKRSRGYVMYMGDVEELIPVVKKQVSPYDMFIRNTSKAYKLLSESGFWPDMCEMMKGYSKLTEEEYNQAMKLYEDCWFNSSDMSSDEYFEKNKATRDAFDNFFKEKNIKSDFYHFAQLSSKGQIISVPYTNGGRDKEMMLKDVERKLEAVKAGEVDNHASLCWYGSYDYSVEFAKDEDNHLRGWHSQEFKGCGNGHYYLLLDTTHAIFYEDD